VGVGLAEHFSAANFRSAQTQATNDVEGSAELPAFLNGDKPRESDR
jgi:hypothetical protein